MTTYSHPITRGPLPQAVQNRIADLAARGIGAVVEALRQAGFTRTTGGVKGRVNYLGPLAGRQRRSWSAAQDRLLSTHAPRGAKAVVEALRQAGFRRTVAAVLHRGSRRRIAFGPASAPRRHCHAEGLLAGRTDSTKHQEQETTSG